MVRAVARIFLTKLFFCWPHDQPPCQGKGVGVKEAKGLGACSKCPSWGRGAKSLKLLISTLCFSLKCLNIIQIQAWKVAFTEYNLKFQGSVRNFQKWALLVSFVQKCVKITQKRLKITLLLAKRALLCQILQRAASDYRTLISSGLFPALYEHLFSSLLNLVLKFHAFARQDSHY